MKHLGGGGGELGFEAELMKLHNQRFLFTIIEETKADLESDDEKSRSLSDLPVGVNDCTTPGFTPLASPCAPKSSPLESYSHHGFNPLFETEGELEFNKFFRSSSSSPPPKFKFLRDAEEKLRRRMVEEARKREETEGSFLKFLNPEMMNREKKQSSQEYDETVSFSVSSSSSEIFYLLRWKKIISQESQEEEQQAGYAKELIQLLCFKNHQPLHANNGGREAEISRTQDIELGLMKHLGGGGGELGFEAELMKLHNQRFLFTIIEETKADLESDDEKSRSLSDLPVGVNDCTTPGFTPLASPCAPKSSPLESYSHHGFNPLFETEGELEFNKFFRSSSSSPPPKFKFLRDAEEKLRRRMVEEARKREETEGSFLKFLNPEMMNREKKQSSQESDETVSFSVSSSSSGTNLRTLDRRSTLVV
ncbi:hypothetical protein F2Q69_00000993 [Brassica cretica]|uniref:Uncharacterized protein n=1 Tax=Brassica cretica TaxID=69181 RepID=A0A8S9NVX9_BRACR|nr:hypothetical protein F2Q69_00000993 [Brassica cretica]